MSKIQNKIVKDIMLKLGYRIHQRNLAVTSNYTTKTKQIMVGEAFGEHLRVFEILSDQDQTLHMHLRNFPFDSHHSCVSTDRGGEQPCRGKPPKNG
jgi:hypothetical protein